MLPQDSILRHLPHVVETDQRLIFEAFVYASDILGLSFNRMRYVGSKYLNKDESWSHSDRVSMFLDAWAAVDQIHVVRQLFKKLGPMGPKQAAFCKKFESATLMRNRMDHLAGNFANISKRKGMKPPIYGALSYLEIMPENLSEKDGNVSVTGASVVTLTAGRSYTEGVLMGSPNLRGPFTPPICGFALAAFDWMLSIEDAVRELQDLLLTMSTRANEELTVKLTAESEKRGLKLADLMAEPPLSRLTLRIKIQYTP